MDSNKIIIVSLPRSGSSYVCNVVEECFLQQKVDFIKINPEIANIEQWTKNRLGIIDKNLNVINALNLNPTVIDSHFVNQMFLHYITQPKPLVLKFFPYDSYDFSIDELIAVSKKHKIRIFCLYRTNMLDALVSRIVSRSIVNTNKTSEKSLLSTKFKYDSSIIERDIVSAHRLFIDMYQKLSENNLVESVIEYENLTFNLLIDSNIFFKDLPIVVNKKLTTKLTSSAVKHEVLRQMPWLESDLKSALQTSELPIVDDFYFSLNG